MPIAPDRTRRIRDTAFLALAASENDRYIMSIGSTRPLIDALRLACVDLIDWLATDYGHDKLEAYQLLGQQAVIKIANVVDPQYAVACAIDKAYLPE